MKQKTNMKQKTHSYLVIICSLISGAIGAFLIVFAFELYDATEHARKGRIAEIKHELKYIVNDKELENIKKDLESVKKKSELQGLQNNITNIVENISPSVVSIVIKKDLVVYRSDPFGFFQQPVGSVERKVGGGTGFFIQADGTLITNKHVVKDDQAIYTIITNDNKEYDARVIALDPINDIAIMRVEAEENFTPLGIIKDNENTKLGQFVLAVGNALSEFQNSVSLGIISGKDRNIETIDGKLGGLLQTDAAINPGNSGGPLVNLEGEVIGINTAITERSEAIGFSISLSEEKINYILKSIKDTGRIKRPFLGIAYIPISQGVQDELNLPVNYGVYIINEPGSIIKGSSAETAGIEPGDLILEVDNQRIDINNDLNTFIQNKIPGTEVNLKIMKGSGEEKDVKLKLGEY